MSALPLLWNPVMDEWTNDQVYLCKRTYDSGWDNQEEKYDLRQILNCS